MKQTVLRNADIYASHTGMFKSCTAAAVAVQVCSYILSAAAICGLLAQN
jgi:hypothetical protein